MKTMTRLLAGALAAATLLPVSPAGAGVPRLAVVGQKDDDTVILLDMGSRRNAEGGRVEADGVLVFPKAAPALQLSPANGAPAPAIPDKGHVTLQFDCKGRTITLVRLALFNAEGEVTQTATPAPDPQTPVDPTDAHMLAYACGEAFPPADKTFADEKAAIMAVRAKP